VKKLIKVNLYKLLSGALLFALLTSSITASAPVPNLLSYIGENKSRVTGMINGEHELTVKFWRDSPDTPLSVYNVNGSFVNNVFFFSIVEADLSIFDAHNDVRISIFYEHEGHPELLWEYAIETIPYSAKSRVATVAKSVDWSNVQNKPSINQFSGNISPSQIPNGIINSDMVASISADKLTNLGTIKFEALVGDSSGFREMKIENTSNNNGAGSRLYLKGSNGSNTAEFSVLKDASSGVNAVHLRSLSSANDLLIGIDNMNYIQLDASEKRLVIPVKTSFGEAVSFDGGFDLGSDISAKNESINNNTKARLSAKADGGTGVVTSLSSLKDGTGNTFGSVGTETENDFKVQRNNATFFTLKKEGSESVIEFEEGLQIRGGTFTGTVINPSSMEGKFAGITGVGTLDTLNVGTDTVFPWQTSFDVIQMDTLSVFSKDSVGGLAWGWYKNELGSVLYGSGNDVYASSLEFNKATGTLSYKVTPTPEDGGAVVASMPSVFSINKDGEASFTGTVNGESANFSGSVSASGFTGNGQNLTGINGANISDGQIHNDRFNALSDLGGGSGNLFLKQNGAWASPLPSESLIEGYINNDVNSGYVPYSNGSKLVTSGLYTNGYFGIGTSSPFASLTLGADVSGASNGHLGFADGTDSRRARAYNHAGNFFLVTHGLDNVVNAGLSVYPAPGQIGFLAGGETKMVLDSNGNLGLGIGIPEHKLHVKNGDIALGTYNGTGSIHFLTGWLDEIKASSGGMEYHSGANHRFVLDKNNNQSGTYLSVEDQQEGSTSVVFKVEEDGNVTATGTGQFAKLIITDGANDGGNVPKKPVDVNGNTISGIQPDILIEQSANLDTSSTIEINTGIDQSARLLNVIIQIRDNSGNLYPINYQESFGYASASGQKVLVYTEGTEQPDGFRVLNLANAWNAKWKTYISGNNHTVRIERRGDGFYDSSNFSNATVVIVVKWAN
jgi:hypothetical protein